MGFGKQERRRNAQITLLISIIIFNVMIVEMPSLPRVYSFKETTLEIIQRKDQD